MSHLIQISIGPVQGFIAASRKTRDLKAGSDLLMALTTAAATSVAIHGRLIFPPRPDIPAANVVTAEVESEPSTVLTDVEQAIEEALNARWNRLDLNASVDATRVDHALAKRQIKAFPEVTAAWVDQSIGDYRVQRKHLGMATAARKALRDFEPSPGTRGGLPKSPLDPSLDTVLPVIRNRIVLRPEQVALKKGESLDAMSLMKRFSRIPFPSTREIANAALVRRFREHDNVREFVRLAEATGEEPFDLVVDPQLPAPGELGDLRKKIRSDLREGGSLKAYSYYAILLADGDSMGRYLDGLTEANHHRAFSERLFEQFAQHVPGIVSRHDGALVYAGGDDVLALLPFDRAIECAGQLHEQFARAMPEQVPTLSAGIAIVHVKEDLQEAIDIARQMEQLAKKQAGKDHLAVGAKPRGGALAATAIGWGASGRLQRLIEVYLSGDVPRGFPFEVERLADELSLQERTLADTLAPPELRRIAKRKDADAETLMPLFDWVATHDDLIQFGKLLRIAHFVTRTGEEN